jgi:hypothetical protein
MFQNEYLINFTQLDDLKTKYAISPNKQETMYKKYTCMCLVAKSQAAHTAHDAQHVVVGGVHAHGGGGGGTHGIVRHRQQQGGVINAG